MHHELQRWESYLHKHAEGSGRPIEDTRHETFKKIYDTALAYQRLIVHGIVEATDTSDDSVVSISNYELCTRKLQYSTMGATIAHNCVTFSEECLALNLDSCCRIVPMKTKLNLSVEEAISTVFFMYAVHSKSITSKTEEQSMVHIQQTFSTDSSSIKKKKHHIWPRRICSSTKTMQA